MATRLVIDGYNFICASKGLSGSHPGGMDLEMERDSLFDDLVIYRRQKRTKITVVFDGASSTSIKRERTVENGIEKIFSRPGEEADDIIKEMAKESGPGLTVVTSDRAVKESAESSGSVVLSSSEFFEILELALYAEMKGVDAEDEEDGPKGFGVKKGPARKLSKKERQKKQRIKKL